jgi:mono/diheme cytochrome c family protein
MMTKRFGVLLSAAVLALSAAMTATSDPQESQAQPATQAAPTFARDVAPVLYKNCVSCHREGEIGPMALVTYENVRPWARAIREAVTTGAMPPWHADAPHGTFENERRLTVAEKDTLVRWVSAGAPLGDPKDLPKPPVFTEGWSIGTPDLVVSMTEPYEVPASGTIEYQFFEVPTNLTEDKWIEAMEIRPGARSVVHHVIVYEREPKPSQRVRFVQQDPKIAMTPPSPGQGQRMLGYQLCAVATGTEASVFRPGTARPLKAGSVLTFQIHYTTNGDAAKDQTKIGFRFAKRPPEYELRAFNMINGVFVIPAGASDHRVESSATFTEDVTLYAMLPHTHLRGKRWEYTLTFPDGRSEVLLSVPKYDFGWQTDYKFANPLRIPKGSKITGAAWYDNSKSNPSNPDPTQDVRWGDQTWEEMQFTAFLVTVDKAPLTAPTTAQN